MILYRLRYWRIKRRLTQAALGCLVGVDSTVISRWETLRIAARTVSAMRLAAALGVSVRDLAR